MASPKMPASPRSPHEQFQDGLSGISSPKTSADQSKMSEVNLSFYTTDNSRVLIGSNDASGTSKKPYISNQGGQRDKLYTSLRAIVNEFSSELRRSSDEVLDPDPISYCLPQNYGEATSNPSSSAEAKTRARSTLAGEATVSFVLPPDCQIGTDSNKNIQQQSLFEERLRGWHLQCRQRANGKLDMFYHHGLSRRMFRSTVGVVEFIMDAFMMKETSENNSVQVPIQEQGPATAAKGSLKRNISFNEQEEIPPYKLFKISSAEKFRNAQSETSTSFDNISVEKANPENDVKRSLEESHNNHMNFFCSGSQAQESEQERDKCLKSSSENKGDASIDKETPTTGKS